MNLQITGDGGEMRESVGAGAELARAVRISLAGIDLGQPAAFHPASSATADFDWQAWLRGNFSATLGAAFIEIFGAAGSMQVREAMAIDAGLDPVAGLSSRVAGGALLDRLESARKLRVVDRMRVVLDGKDPHFLTAFAVECAEFHLPLRAALISYLYGEWRCGMSILGQRGDLDAFATAGGGVTVAVVGEILSAEASPFDHAAGL